MTKTGSILIMTITMMIMFHNDALPPVEEQLADPVVEPQQVGVRHSIPLPGPEPPDSLVEPDGDVHGQHLM